MDRRCCTTDSAEVIWWVPNTACAAVRSWLLETSLPQENRSAEVRRRPYFEAFWILIGLFNLPPLLGAPVPIDDLPDHVFICLDTRSLLRKVMVYRKRGPARRKRKKKRLNVGLTRYNFIVPWIAKNHKEPFDQWQSLNSFLPRRYCEGT